MRSTKEPLLRQAGYSYNFDRMVYVNRSSRKAFSLEWVEDHPEQELRERMNEPNATGTWQIYFNTKPSESVLREFLAEVG